MAKKSASTTTATKPKPKTRSGAGRPQGSQTEKLISEAQCGRCPKCQATNREKYSNVRVMDYAGTNDGHPYTHIVWRRTRCTNCGQSRIDRFFENRK